jgi:hypothetical protein
MPVFAAGVTGASIAGQEFAVKCSILPKRFPLPNMRPSRLPETGFSSIIEMVNDTYLDMELGPCRGLPSMNFQSTERSI